MRRALVVGPRLGPVSRRLLCSDVSGTQKEAGAFSRAPEVSKSPGSALEGVATALGVESRSSDRLSDPTTGSTVVNEGGVLKSTLPEFVANAASQTGTTSQADDSLNVRAAESSPTGDGVELPAGDVDELAAEDLLSVNEVEMSAETPVPSSATPFQSADSLADHLRALIRRGSLRKASTSYREALESNSPELITKDTLYAAMPALSRVKWYRTIADTLSFVERRKLEVPTNVMNFALGAVTKLGNVKVVEKAIEYMWTQPMFAQPNAMSYNALIATYFYRGRVDDAYAVLGEMKNRMVYPTLNTYHTLIAGCIRLDAPRRAFETLLAVEHQRYEVSALTIAQVLISCADADDISAVLQLMPRLENALPRYAIEVERLAERRNTYRVATATRTNLSERTALRGEPKLEIAGLLSLMQAAYRNARPDIGERAMAWYSEWYPDTRKSDTAWYCLTGAYAAAGNYTKALNVLARMRNDGLQPSLHHLHEMLVKPLSSDLAAVDEQYYRLVDVISPEEGAARRAAAAEAARAAETASCGDEAIPESAESIPDDTAAVPEKDEKVTPDSSPGTGSAVNTLRAILDSAGKSPLADEEPVGDSPGAGDIKIDEFNCIIAACSAVGDLDRAFHSYDEAQRLGLERNTDTFNALLAGCVVDRHYVGGGRVLQEMRASGVPEDEETVHLLVRLCVRCGQFSEALKYVSDAVDEGRPVATGSFQTLARKFMRLGLLEDTRRVIALGERCGISKRATLSRVEGTFVRDIALLDGDQVTVPRSTRRSRSREAELGENGGVAQEAGSLVGAASG